MKIGPVCGDATFDDQSVCFGCLHSYESDVIAENDGVGVLAEEVQPRESMRIVQERSGQAAVFERLFDLPATFKVTISPLKDEKEGSAWSCVVEHEGKEEPPR